MTSIIEAEILLHETTTKNRLSKRVVTERWPPDETGENKAD